MIDLWCASTPKDIGHFMEPRPQPLYSSLAFLLHSPSIGSSAVVHKYHRAIAYLPVPGILPVCGIHVGEFPHGSLATITTHYRMSGFQPRLAASKPTSHRSIKNIGVEGFEPPTFWSQTRRSSQTELHSENIC